VGKTWEDYHCQLYPKPHREHVNGLYFMAVCILTSLRLHVRFQHPLCSNCEVFMAVIMEVMLKCTF